MAFRIGKKISELSAVNSLKLTDLILVSYQQAGVFYSKKMTVQDFKNDLKDKLKADMVLYFNQLSDDLDDYKDQLSGDLVELCCELSANLDDAIYIKNDLRTSSNNLLTPLKHAMALSTLNHWTWVGENIDDPVNGFKAVGEYADVDKHKLLWFKPSGEDYLNEAKGMSKINDLQYLVYRLGLQVKELDDILNVGVVPGDTDVSYKDLLLLIADDFEIPDELVSTSDLAQIGIYGDYYVKNGSKYYAIFNPAGFLYDGNISTIKWSIENHVVGDSLTRLYSVSRPSTTFTLATEALISNSAITKYVISSYRAATSMEVSDDVYTKYVEITPSTSPKTYKRATNEASSVLRYIGSTYTEATSAQITSATVDKYINLNQYDILKVLLEPFNNESTTSCLVYLVNFYGYNGYNSSPTVYSSSKSIINNTIDNILTYGNLSAIEINISTDIEDTYGDKVEMTQPWEGVLTKTGDDEEPINTYSLSIMGSDYCEEYTYWYSRFNDDTSTLPFTSDVTWSIYKQGTGGSGYIKTNSITFTREDPDNENSYLSGTVSIVNLRDNACFLRFNDTLKNNKSVFSDCLLSLLVESNYDNTLSDMKLITVGGLLVDTTDVDATVKAVCAKLGTTEGFVEKMSTLYKGELLYLTDEDRLAVYNGTNIVRAGGDSSSSESSGNSGTTEQALTIDQLSVVNTMDLDHLTFKKSYEGIRHTLEITSDGLINILKKTGGQTVPTSITSNGVYGDNLLLISKVYCGGSNSGNSNCLVSHNFVEITNASLTKSYNLDNVMLLYFSKTTSEWEYIKLSGVIEAGGTFLVRGACCNSSNSSIIKVDKFDLEWRQKVDGDSDGDDGRSFSRTGNLVQFNQDMSLFYLMLNTVDTSTGGGNRTALLILMAGTDTSLGRNIWSSTAAPFGYIDLVAMSTDPNDGDYGEGRTGDDGYSILDTTGHDMNNILFMKWFYMDPSTQANKKYSARITKNVLTYIDLSKHTTYDGNSCLYYYTDELKRRLAPHASYEKYNFFSNKTTFDVNVPNMIKVTFGILATVNDSVTPNIKASRCFNWISVGYFDEYLSYRKIEDENGNSVTSDWINVRSITSSNHEEYIEPFHKFYDRLRWTSADGTIATSHKVILHNCLTAGKYEYIVRRFGDDNYKSESNTFKVLNDSLVLKFSFIQVTDQLGFNWLEYQAWKQSCYMLEKEERGDFNFTINTGDIAQSGNRPNEWLDYHDGRLYISDKEEMFTIGNNDLCGIKDNALTNGNDATSKFNLYNILKYFTFECDPNNYFDNSYKFVSGNYVKCLETDSVSTKYYRINKTDDSEEYKVLTPLYSRNVKYRKAEDWETPVYVKVDTYTEAEVPYATTYLEAIGNETPTHVLNISYSVATDTEKSDNTITKYIFRTATSTEISSTSILKYVEITPSTTPPTYKLETTESSSVLRYIAVSQGKTVSSGDSSTTYYVVSGTTYIESSNNPKYIKVDVFKDSSGNVATYYKVSGSSPAQYKEATSRENANYVITTTYREATGSEVPEYVLYVTFNTSGTKEYVYDSDIGGYRKPNRFYNVYGLYKGTLYPIYSVYSYNYGKWHFVSLTSEIRSYYYLVYDSSASDTALLNFSNTLNATIIRWFIKDLTLFDNRSNHLYPECIVYMHEMPFTIVTDSYDKKPTTKFRSCFSDPDGAPGCKLNIEVGTINSDGWIVPDSLNFVISRIFKKYGIRLVMGGHKHTFSISKPIYDAPDTIDNILITQSNGRLSTLNDTGSFNTDAFINTDAFLTEDVSLSSSRFPVIEVTSDDDCTGLAAVSIGATGSKQRQCRYVKVAKITAPTYVMCQATGYKLVSNKEMASSNNTPWLLSYFASAVNGTSIVENCYQHRPMYIKYTLDTTDSSNRSITIVAKQVDGIYDVTSQTSTSYDFNIQNPNLNVVPMTFGDISKNKILDVEERLRFVPTVSSIRKSYNNMIHGNEYKITL